MPGSENSTDFSLREKLIKGNCRISTTGLSRVKNNGIIWLLIRITYKYTNNKKEMIRIFVED